VVDGKAVAFAVLAKKEGSKVLIDTVNAVFEKIA
jgi:hypothetical protein